MLAELPKVVLIHAIAATVAAACFWWTKSGSVAALGVAWFGGFLSWLTARSHVSSSILLCMVHLLRGGPLRASELLERYQSGHAPGERSRQLRSAGLIRSEDPRPTPTLAGRVLSRLGHKLW